MPLPVNNIRSIVLALLPLVLLTMAVSVVIWAITQTQPLPTGHRLAMHQALQNIPENEMADQLRELLPRTMFKGRDPFFRPPTAQPLNPDNTSNKTETAALQEIHLTTIASGKRGNYCLINGKIYHEGQKGLGFTVALINQNEVIFSTPVQNFTLSPGKKVTLEAGKLLNRENKQGEAGINNSDVDNQ
ncbi:MAG: hypothetical protein ACI8ZB_003230 [Desulforhopalus sp.]|jgi:hypothetical protein